MKPDIGRESRFLPTPRAFDAFVRGGGDLRRSIAIEKLEWCGYPTVEKLKIGLFFSTEYTNVTDGRTDTAGRHRPRACA